MFIDMTQLKNVNGKDLKISYPCVVLNVMVAQHQTNPQYATLVDAERKTYETSSEMSIEFEVDGPYKVRIASGPFSCFCWIKSSTCCAGRCHIDSL